MDARRLNEIYCFATELGEGIDPTSHIHFQEDTILNNVQILAYNKDVARIIKRLLQDINRYNSPSDSITIGKLPFTLSEEVLSTFPYSENPITISELVQRMNDFKNVYMKKLRSKDVTQWLLEEGMLVIATDERGYKKVTMAGEKLGIMTAEKKNNDGDSYYVNYYNKIAQEYVLSHYVL